jgi:hypothetical protein
MGLVIIYLGKCVKTILGKHHLMPALLKKYFCATPYGVAVVNYQNFEGRCCGAQGALLQY